MAANVLAHGTGGVNIDACRVTMSTADLKATIRNGDYGETNPGTVGFTKTAMRTPINPEGRWPANVVLSHAMTPEGFDACADGCVDGCAVKVLDDQSGTLTSGTMSPANNIKASTNSCMSGANQASRVKSVFTGDSGGASRFYNIFRYQAKAPKSERPIVNGKAHPTVKPLALMEWLVTLFTPPGGVVGDWFAGTGTTAHAALKLGFSSIIAENNPKYYPHIDQRLNKYLQTVTRQPLPQMPWMAS